jgi:predicted MPP superfamily phosphohydrolase
MRSYVFGFIALFVIAAFFFFTHYAIYVSILRVYAVNDGLLKRILSFSLIFLGSSFILSSVLAHFSDHPAIRWYYLGSAVWFGFLMYGLFACAAGWITSVFVEKTAFPFGVKSIGSAFFAAAFSLTCIGVLQARTPQLKRETVHVRNLPDQWRGKTVVHVSDLHLGVIHGEKYIRKVVSLINQVDPELVLITGDYFDGTAPIYEKYAKPLRDLRSGRGIYFVTGNHEQYIKTDRALAALSDAGVTVLRNQLMRIDGLTLIGVDYAASGTGDTVERMLSQIGNTGPAVFLFHAPKYINLAKASGVSLQLAGHIHKGQAFPYSLVTRLAYGRYYYGLSTEGDYSIHTTSGTGTWGPPMRIGTRSEIAVLTLERKTQ